MYTTIYKEYTPELLYAMHKNAKCTHKFKYQIYAIGSFVEYYWLYASLPNYIPDNTS